MQIYINANSNCLQLIAQLVYVSQTETLARFELRLFTAVTVWTVRIRPSTALLNKENGGGGVRNNHTGESIKRELIVIPVDQPVHVREIR